MGAWPPPLFQLLFLLSSVSWLVDAQVSGGFDEPIWNYVFPDPSLVVGSRSNAVAGVNGTTLVVVGGESADATTSATLNALLYQLREYIMACVRFCDIALRLRGRRPAFYEHLVAP